MEMIQPHKKSLPITRLHFSGTVICVLPSGTGVTGDVALFLYIAYIRVDESLISSKELHSSLQKWAQSSLNRSLV